MQWGGRTAQSAVGARPTSADSRQYQPKSRRSRVILPCKVHLVPFLADKGSLNFVMPFSALQFKLYLLGKQESAGMSFLLSKIG